MEGKPHLLFGAHEVNLATVEDELPAYRMVGSERDCNSNGFIQPENLLVAASLRQIIVSSVKI